MGRRVGGVRRSPASGSRRRESRRKGVAGDAANFSAHAARRPALAGAAGLPGARAAGALLPDGEPRRGEDRRPGRVPGPRGPAGGALAPPGGAALLGNARGWRGSGGTRPSGRSAEKHQ